MYILEEDYKKKLEACREGIRHLLDLCVLARMRAGSGKGPQDGASWGGKEDLKDKLLADLLRYAWFIVFADGRADVRVVRCARPGAAAGRILACDEAEQPGMPAGKGAAR